VHEIPCAKHEAYIDRVLGDADDSLRRAIYGSRERLSWRHAHSDDPPRVSTTAPPSVEGGLISYGANLADGYR
jgi:hypothetical protein